MVETVGIRFKDGGKIYDFDADGKMLYKKQNILLSLKVASVFWINITDIICYFPHQIGGGKSHRNQYLHVVCDGQRM